MAAEPFVLAFSGASVQQAGALRQLRKNLLNPSVPGRLVVQANPVAPAVEAPALLGKGLQQRPDQVGISAPAPILPDRIAPNVAVAALRILSRQFRPRIISVELHVWAALHKSPRTSAKLSRRTGISRLNGHAAGSRKIKILIGPGEFS